MSPRLCRIGAKKAFLSFLINQLQLPSSTPLISFACNTCSFLVYIYILHIKFTVHATLSLRALLVYLLYISQSTACGSTCAFNEFYRFHNKRYDHADSTRVFPKVTTESHSLRRGSSYFHCLPSGLISPLQLYTCQNTQPLVRQHENRKLNFLSIKGLNWILTCILTCAEVLKFL